MSLIKEKAQIKASRQLNAPKKPKKKQEKKEKDSVAVNLNVLNTANLLLAGIFEIKEKAPNVATRLRIFEMMNGLTSKTLFYTQILNLQLMMLN